MKEYLVLEPDLMGDDWADAEDMRAFDHYDAAESYAAEIRDWEDGDEEVVVEVMEVKTQKVLKIGIRRYMEPTFTVYDKKD